MWLCVGTGLPARLSGLPELVTCINHLPCCMSSLASPLPVTDVNDLPQNYLDATCIIQSLNFYASYEECDCTQVFHVTCVSLSNVNLCLPSPYAWVETKVRYLLVQGHLYLTQNCYRITALRAATEACIR